MSSNSVKKDSKISVRIKYILENEGISINKFSKILKYTRSQTLYDIVNGKVFPSYDFFFRFFASEISEKYDPIWLLIGVGEPFKSKEDREKYAKVSEPSIEYQSNEKKDLKEDLLKAKDEQIQQLQDQIKFLQHIIEEKM